MSEVVIEQSKEEVEDHDPAPETPYGRFIAINEARIERAHQSLSLRKQAFLDVLPMLFHINHKGLPGYVSETTPAGISSYVPSNRSILEANQIAATSDLDRLASKKMSILGLYFMGSPGTIAYNGQSDFDIWLFTSPDIADEQLEELEKKVSLIEKWAEKSSIEVHFFIVDPEKFRSGETLPLSNESSGSSQHGLLLDEFYRSSILIAGLSLAWWIVPPEFEESYENYLNSQRHVRVTDQPAIDQCINLGPLCEIAPDEFFGAAVWQLNKSIKSPYKSVLKLFLMEVYADDLSGVSLISYQFKKRVYEGIIDISLLDPWMLMYEQVRDYLISKADDLRLNVLYRSFYLKISESAEQTEPQRHKLVAWKQHMLDQLLESWAWDQEQIDYLDSRYQWKLETVLGERTDLVKVLSNSFRNLSNFAKQHSDNPKITQADLEALNRRLFFAFERKVDKVELVNFGISPNMYEDSVSLYLVEPNFEETWGLNNIHTDTSWVLYRGVISQKDVGESSHIKRTSSLIEMLAWAYFNKILDMDSRIMLNASANQKVSQQEIKTILKSFAEQFPKQQQVSGLNQSGPEYMLTGSMFVNTASHAVPSGNSSSTLLSSQRINALSYGGSHQNLINSIDLVYITSLGEIFIKSYNGDKAVSECIIEYISWSFSSKTRSPVVLSTYCYSPGYSAQIRKTLDQLFAQIRDKIVTQPNEINPHLIIEVRDSYYSLEFKNEQVNARVLSDQTALNRYLSKPSKQFTPYSFAPFACEETVLPTIYSVNKPDTIQIYFQLGHHDTATIYILDEQGSLFIQKNSYIYQESLFTNFHLFSKAITERLISNGLNHLLHKKEYRTEMYQIKNNPYSQDSNFLIEPIKASAIRANQFIRLEVLCDRDETNTEQYTIYCQDEEFSSAEYSQNLFAEIAKYVMSHRRSQQNYPAYITDINLSPTMIRDSANTQLQSIHFFRYKKHIETLLTKEINQLKMTS